MEHPIFAENEPIPPELESGRKLIAENDCGSCHAPSVDREGPGIPPDMSFAGSRYQREWMIEYLLKPYRRRYITDSTWPKVKMANFRLQRSEAESIADYLLYHKDSLHIKPSHKLVETEPNVIAHGRELYQKYQCSSCHRIDGNGGRVGPALDGVGSRSTADYVRALLQNPQQVVPDTPMKDNELWDDEIEALVAYLMTLKQP